MRTAALMGMSALLCPLVAGCLGGYAYPTLAVAPAARLEADPADVHVFRVDVADQRCCLCLGECDRYLLTPLTLTENGRTLPQVKVALDHGYFFGGPGLIHESHTRHSVRVRLYRRGFRTVEIAAWEKDRPVEWQAVEGLEGEEKAVDNLVSTWASDSDLQRWQSSDEGKEVPPRDARVFRGLAPGGESRGHRNALLFAAAEYDRLALHCDQECADAQQYARLKEKANALHKLAEE
jgi:hypothetical protein